MLILSRKVGETILIGTENPIEIKVTLIKGNRVALGITAPEDVSIVRGELPRHDDTDKKIA